MGDLPSHTKLFLLFLMITSKTLPKEPKLNEMFVTSVRFFGPHHEA
jgi:hypothetical protein